MKTISSICAGRMLLILTALSFGSIAGTSSALAAAGDLDSVGDVDLVTANYASNDVSVLLGVGDGVRHPEKLEGDVFQYRSVVLGENEDFGRHNLR